MDVSASQKKGVDSQRFLNLINLVYYHIRLLLHKNKYIYLIRHDWIKLFAVDDKFGKFIELLAWLKDL